MHIHHKTMLAAVHYAYGDPDLLRIQQVPIPEVKSGQYLIEIKAVALNPADWKYLEGRWRFFTGKRFPRKVGIEFAGIVREQGQNATKFHIGDEVIGSVNAFKTGTASEYCAVPETAMCLKPQGTDYGAAAGIPIAAGTAYIGLCGSGRNLEGIRVLITGAGGGVGHLAVQLAKHLNAHVTAVCSGEKQLFVSNLGADEVLDYAKSDINTFTDNFDIIFDCAGSIGVRGSKELLKVGGEYILLEIAGKLWLFIASWLSQRFARRKMRTFLAHPSAGRCGKLIELFDSGAMNITIGKRYPLEGISHAMQLLKDGHAKGKIVVDING